MKSDIVIAGTKIIHIFYTKTTSEKKITPTQHFAVIISVQNKPNFQIKGKQMISLDFSPSLIHTLYLLTLHFCLYILFLQSVLEAGGYEVLFTSLKVFISRSLDFQQSQSSSSSVKRGLTSLVQKWLLYYYSLLC